MGGQCFLWGRTPYSLANGPRAGHLFPNVEPLGPPSQDCYLPSDVLARPSCVPFRMWVWLKPCPVKGLVSVLVLPHWHLAMCGVENQKLLQKEAAWPSHRA